MGFMQFTIEPYKRVITRDEWNDYLKPYRPDSIPELVMIGFIVLACTLCILMSFFAAVKFIRSRTKISTGLFSKQSFMWCDIIDFLLAFSLAVITGRARYFDRA